MKQYTDTVEKKIWLILRSYCTKVFQICEIVHYNESRGCPTVKSQPAISSFINYPSFLHHLDIIIYYLFSNIIWFLSIWILQVTPNNYDNVIIDSTEFTTNESTIVLLQVSLKLNTIQYNTPHSTILKP